MNKEKEKLYRKNSVILVTGDFERPLVKSIAGRAKRLLGKKCRLASVKSSFGKKNYAAAVVIGGDGTMLRAVRKTDGRIPAMGIAAGSKNALMEIDAKQMKAALGLLSTGKFTAEKRMRLQATIDSKKMPAALNEILVTNKKTGCLSVFTVSHGKSLVDIKADGVIFATPTGSTGHAHSAGGKKLGIGSNRVGIVPSNPLGRKLKPFYVESGTKIRVWGFKKGKYEAVVDGKIRKDVDGKIRIRPGKSALFIKFQKGAIQAR